MRASVYLLICLCFFLSVYSCLLISVCLFLSACVCLLVSIYLCMSGSVYRSMGLSGCRSLILYLSVYLSIFISVAPIYLIDWTLYLEELSIYLSICLFIAKCFHDKMISLSLSLLLEATNISMIK